MALAQANIHGTKSSQQQMIRNNKIVAFSVTELLQWFLIQQYITKGVAGTFLCAPEWGDFYLYSGFANEECAHCLWPWSLIIWGLGESYSTVYSRMADGYDQLSTQFQISLGAFTKIGDIALEWDPLLHPPTSYLTLRTEYVNKY